MPTATTANPHLQPHADVCLQAPAFLNIQKTLDRWDKRMDRQDDLMERQAVAMETIAMQGAMVAGHEKRLDKHDLDMREVFNRVNDQTKIDALERRLTAVELHLAEEAGAETVTAKTDKFWTEVKLKLVTPILVGVFFLLWLTDKFGVFTFLLQAWKEFKK